MQTEAEALFETYCRGVGIPIRRIPEARTKTPDYEVHFGDRPIAVEVKQIEPNEADRNLLHRLRSTGRASASIDMGRPRECIKDAGRQLRAHAKGRMPAIVVLHNTIGPVIDYLNPYALSFCLFGPEKVHLAVGKDPRDDIDFLGMSRGGKRVATSSHNTTISAVGTLLPATTTGEIQLALFHNLHAAMPLHFGEAARYGIPEYDFHVPSSGATGQWIRRSE